MNIENDPTLSDSSSDIAAAIASASNGAPATTSTPATIDTSSNDTLPPANGQHRDASGRFVASPGAPDGQQAPTTGGSPAPATDGQPGATGAAPGAPAASVQPAAPAATDPNAPQIFDKAKPPSAWTPEMKAKWDSVPEDIRAEITRREEASYQGFEKFRKQAEPALNMYDQFVQNEQYFQHVQVAPENYSDYIGSMIATEQTLVLGNPAQKFEKMLEIGDLYGIPMRQILDQAMGGGLGEFLAESHRNLKTPAPVDPAIQKELNELRKFRDTQAMSQAEAQLNAMRADTANFPLLEEASDEMANIMERGLATDFKEAYELAVWRTPELRAKDQAIRNGNTQQQSVQQRQSAAAAVASPSPSAAAVVKNDGVDNESTEETLRRVMAAAANGAGRA
ncbi:hypothetical protein [Stenotrophomonas phage BUCT555]|nr:hypothetical protein [Stenotrophomonas phage BUCT555]